MFDLFRSRDHRAEALGKIARARGIQFSPDDPFGCERAPFPLLRRGDTRKVSSVLWRDDDPHVVRVFDYRYFSDRGDWTDPSPLFTGATLLANAAWPYLSVTPAPGKLGFSTRLDGHHTFDMLDPAFAEAFTVRTSDDRFATALLDAGMRRFLLDTARALDIEFNGAWCFAFAEQIPVDLVPNVFGFLDDLLARIPRVVGLLYPPPLEGGMDTAMPDPGELARPEETVSDEILRASLRRRRSSSRRALGSLFGLDTQLPSYDDMIATGAAELATHQSIIDSDRWTDIGDRSGAAADEDPDKEEFDLDGNPIEPHAQDPWGPGRPMPEQDR